MDVIIDGDGHFIEPVHLWSDYVPAAMRDQDLYVTRGEDGLVDKLIVGNMTRAFRLPESSPFGMGDYLNPGGIWPGRARSDRLKKQLQAVGTWQRD